MSETQIYGKVTNIGTRKSTSSTGWRKLIGLGYPIIDKSGKSHYYKQSDSELLRANVAQLLQTEKGERVMLPDYGIGLSKYLFQPLDRELFELIKEDVIYGIGKFAPGVILKKVRVYPTESSGVGGQNAFKVSVILGVKEEPRLSVEVEVKIG